jgi:hypothetical protein
VGPQSFYGTREVQSFVSAIHNADAALSELTPLLLQVDGYRAGLLALLCGNLVEKGGVVAVPIGATLALMVRQLEQASDLPVIDGMPVLLVGKRAMRFSWEPANMYPILHKALKSEVSLVRELPGEEVEAWLQRFSRPAV